MNASKIILTAMAAVVVSGPALAGTPLVDQRQNRQAHRIYNGIQNGNLTFQEAATLINRHTRIRVKEKQFKSDGVVTAAERGRLFLMQTRQGIRIYNKKHN